MFQTRPPSGTFFAAGYAGFFETTEPAQDQMAWGMIPERAPNFSADDGHITADKRSGPPNKDLLPGKNPRHSEAGFPAPYKRYPVHDIPEHHGFLFPKSKRDPEIPNAPLKDKSEKAVSSNAEAPADGFYPENLPEP